MLGGGDDLDVHKVMSPIQETHGDLVLETGSRRQLENKKKCICGNILVP